MWVFTGKNRNRSAVIPAQAGIQTVRFRFFLRFRVTLNRHFLESGKSKTETSNPVIPAQAGIQGVKSKETVLSDKFPQQQTRFPPARE
ncbi:hypothetical protein [Neisseria benedictiae]|uniref:hypothetical protein n=1 Tax=Neisseria benedictiae TaxID=2830649 RepID=UPI00265A545D|nr:hypothetical protein [Neisseria benedictiae]